jgi:hypothetical protein
MFSFVGFLVKEIFTMGKSTWNGPYTFGAKASKRVAVSTRGSVRRQRFRAVVDDISQTGRDVIPAITTEVAHISGNVADMSHPHSTIALKMVLNLVI